MPGPEQPDKTTDKSSSQAGKLEKAAGEKLSQDAFPAPPKDGAGGDSNKGTVATDKDSGASKGGDDKFPQGEGSKFPQGEGGKLPQNDPGKDTKVPDPGDAPPAKQEQGFSGKKPTMPESSPPPEKQPSKPPLGDGSGQFDKPPPPAQSADFGMPQKDPTESNKKIPTGDGQSSLQSKPPLEPRSGQSDTGIKPNPEAFNSGNKPPVEPRSGHTDGGTRPHADVSNAGSKPPVDQGMNARSANQDLPEKLPQKQPPSQDSPRSTAVDHKPNAPAPREERPVATPAGSEAQRPHDAGRVAPRSAPDADHQAAQRAAERPRIDPPSPKNQERRAESPTARQAEAHAGQQSQSARSADAQSQAGADRARSQSAAGEAGQLNRANLNPRDQIDANRPGAPADAATSRRGEAAIAEKLSRSPNAGAEQRHRDTAETEAGRIRRPQGAGAPAGDDARTDTSTRSLAARGSLEKSASHPDARASAAGDVSKLAEKDAQPAGSRAETSPKGTLEAASRTGRPLAGDSSPSAERATTLRPEMKALADLVGRRAEQQDVSSARGPRPDIQQTRLPSGGDGHAIRTAAGQVGTGDRTHGDTSRRLDDRGVVPTTSATDKTGPAVPRPIDATPRVQDPAAGAKSDATATGARSPENVVGARQPGKSPADSTAAAQPGARPPAEAGTGIRQPDRGAADAQGQGRQPVKGASDVPPVRQPGTASGDGKPTALPPQRSGVDAAGDGRTAVQGDPAGRLPSTRVDGSDRAPVKPGSMLEPLKPGDKRELTGAEIAIAAIVAAAGAARVRPEDARIQRGQQPVDKDPLAAIQDALTPKGPMAVPIGFLPEFHVEGDAIALRGTNGGDAVEKAAIVEAEAVPDQTVVAPAPVFLRPTCLVSENDTLISIAEELFHDPNLGWLIADLNRDRIQERFEDGKRIVEIASRQELFVPVWQDIVEFYESRSQAAAPENLVTIVSQSQLDRELLNSTLAKVVGAAPAAPFGSPAAISAAGRQSSASVQAPAKSAQDWKALAAGLPKATAAALLSFSNRWPKPPAAPASDDIV